METSIIAIVSSIIIGVFTNLLTPYISKFLENLFKSIKKRNDTKKLIFENTVQYILENPLEEINLRIRHWGRAITATVVMMVSILMMYSSNSIQIIFGFIFFMIGNFGNIKANRLGKILDEVGKRKKTYQTKIDLD